ncbi:pyridine nucleotide-disulfide oxidoreductase domain-containing protein 2-like [Branchiostoma floridae x Branchiostoma belcheri]
MLSVRTLCKRLGYRLARRTASTAAQPELKTEYDAIIVGGGHNGLVAAAYLQRSGINTVVLERRHVIGGAAVTEELVPGYKFSRASYVLSLLRPKIISELELKRHGLKVYLRDPNSFTPLLEPDGTGQYRSLLLGRDLRENQRQIAQFSHRDAEIFPEYEHTMSRIGEAIEPLLDNAPLDLQRLSHGSRLDKMRALMTAKPLADAAKALGSDLNAFIELLTAPANKMLDKWFESEPLKATLATDAVIGAMLTPNTPGSGYVLLHHVMGELEGVKGAWGYVEGGMGAVSQAIANSAQEQGATVLTEKPVSSIMVNGSGEACGVVLEDGTEIKATMQIVMSNATPKVTYLDLLSKDLLPADFLSEVSHVDYKSPVTKINVAVNQLPNFKAAPNTSDNAPLPHHRCTIHLNCEDSGLIDDAYHDAVAHGIPSKKPVIEMCIPSSLDPTIAPEGCHVVTLFTQYTPYHRKDGREWDDQARDEYADRVFDNIEDYAPGFKVSVVGRDILTPPDLEKTFGLTGGNIFHGAMSLDQLYQSRPVPSFGNHRCPIKGLYLCGSGAHPGGGVMGAAGKNAATVALADLRR